MNAFYFGDTEKRLFGIHHSPSHPHVRETAILLCYPLAQEYMLAHRAFQRLATMLSSCGFHVLRFDYFGTGDSAGEGHEGNVNQWVADIHAALEELKHTSGATKVSLAGFRLGATLAAVASAEQSCIETLVLWDPVVDGKTYIETLEELHKQILVDPWHFHRPRVESIRCVHEQLVGFPFPREMRIDIEDINLLRAPSSEARKVLVVSEEKEEYSELRHRLTAAGAPLVYRVIPDAGGRDKIENVHSALMSNKVLQTIVSTLLEERHAREGI